MTGFSPVPGVVLPGPRRRRSGQPPACPSPWERSRLPAERVWRRRSRHAGTSWAILAALALLLLLCAWLVGGPEGALLALLGAAAAQLFGAAASPAGALMRVFGARPLHPFDAPELTGLLDELARRAALPGRPRLLVIPRSDLQAFAAGEGEDAVVAVSAGLVRSFGPREMAAILAHEVSHLQAGDPALMRMAAGMGQAVRVVSGLGLGLALLGAYVPALPLLAIAPLAGDLLWLRLSREREFDADAGAVALTGDPGSLARALAVLERVQGGSWETRYQPPRWVRWLRTHPFARERIRRLDEFAQAPAWT